MGAEGSVHHCCKHGILQASGSRCPDSSVYSSRVICTWHSPWHVPGTWPANTPVAPDGYCGNVQKILAAARTPHLSLLHSPMALGGSQGLAPLSSACSPICSRLPEADSRGGKAGEPAPENSLFCLSPILGTFLGLPLPCKPVLAHHQWPVSLEEMTGY